jgi:hypothetical protein
MLVKSIVRETLGIKHHVVKEVSHKKGAWHGIRHSWWY